METPQKVWVEVVYRVVVREERRMLVPLGAIYTGQPVADLIDRAKDLAQKHGIKAAAEDDKYKIVNVSKPQAILQALYWDDGKGELDTGSRMALDESN